MHTANEGFQRYFGILEFLFAALILFAHHTIMVDELSHMYESLQLSGVLSDA